MAYKPQAGKTISEPNVIPMADVMLCLLIIFMVVTPMLQKGFTVDMASATNTRDMQEADAEDAIVIAVARDGRIYLGSQQVVLDQITSMVQDRIANRLDKTVYVRSDARAKYGDVVAVVDAIRSAGVDQLGLLTERRQQTGKATTTPEVTPTTP